MNPLLRWVTKIIQLFRPKPAPVSAPEAAVSQPIATRAMRPEEPMPPLKKVEAKIEQTAPKVALASAPLVSKPVEAVVPKAQESVPPVTKTEVKPEPATPKIEPKPEALSKPVEVIAPKAQESVLPVTKTEVKPESATLKIELKPETISKSVEVIAPKPAEIIRPAAKVEEKKVEPTVLPVEPKLEPAPKPIEVAAPKPMEIAPPVAKVVESKLEPAILLAEPKLEPAPKPIEAVAPVAKVEEKIEPPAKTSAPLEKAKVEPTAPVLTLPEEKIPEKKSPPEPKEVAVAQKIEPKPEPKPEAKPIFTGRVELTPGLDNPARLKQIKGVISVNDIANRELLDLVPYEPGKPVDDVARELGLDPASIIKLASNENPLGPSPLAMAAMHKAIETSHFYPDGGGFHLRNAIAHNFDLGRENVVLGNGSNEIIELLFHTFTRPGIHEIVTAKHAFAVYTLMAQLFGVHAIEVDDTDFTPDLPAMLRAVTPQTRLIFLASPNNPTGTRVTNEALDAFIRDLPPHVIAVLDEAYYEFLDNPPDTVGYVKSGERVVLMRTFSKIQGLAGLRVGYGLAAAEIANLLQRARQPFNANLIAQAGAMAGLADKEHQQKTKAITDEGRKLIEDAFAKMELKYIPSSANFVMVNVGDGGEVFKRLMKKGIIVRSMVSYHLPEYIRVSIGTPEQNARFLEELPSALEGLSKVAAAVPSGGQPLETSTEGKAPSLGTATATSESSSSLS